MLGLSLRRSESGKAEEGPRRNGGVTCPLHSAPPPALVLILALQRHSESKIINIDFYHSSSCCAVLVLNASGWQPG